MKDKNQEINEMKKVINEKEHLNKTITQQFTNLKTRLFGLVN